MNGYFYNLLVVAVAASAHAAAVVRVGASCGQGVGNGFIVVHALSMACAHGPEGCPQLDVTPKKDGPDFTPRR